RGKLKHAAVARGRRRHWGLDGIFAVQLLDEGGRDIDEGALGRSRRGFLLLSVSGSHDGANEQRQVQPRAGSGPGDSPLRPADEGGHNVRTARDWSLPATKSRAAHLRRPTPRSAS